jgi:hypothetical protein
MNLTRINAFGTPVCAGRMPGICTLLSLSNRQRRVAEGPAGHVRESPGSVVYQEGEAGPLDIYPKRKLGAGTTRDQGLFPSFSCGVVGAFAIAVQKKLCRIFL